MNQLPYLFIAEQKLHVRFLEPSHLSNSVERYNCRTPGLVPLGGIVRPAFKSGPENPQDGVMLNYECSEA